MKRSHNFTCIVCPMSCQIELIEEDDKILEVKGNGCKQGEEYVTEEFTNPVRMLTTTIPVQEGRIAMLPVRSERPVPKNLLRRCMKELSKVRVKAPVRCGDIIYENILDTGVSIISSRDLSIGNYSEFR